MIRLFVPFVFKILSFEEKKMEEKIKSFKDRPWPFMPECLSEIISKDVLEIIQTGISLKHKIPFGRKYL